MNCGFVYKQIWASTLSVNQVDQWSANQNGERVWKDTVNERE